ncbi:MAG: polysaccharide pyruvyl transferase family protein [Candidatus Sumerlaeia bacterium]|nr:polysaccharide pyruvyl transferase family protein [Candidatus Sumerlaeia bacterium]
MSSIFLFDPSIRETPEKPNKNLGDLIIFDAIAREFDFLLSGNQVVRYSTQVELPWGAVWKNRRAACSLICGTNLLSSVLDKSTPWKLTPFQSRFVQPSCLIGVGWWSDQGEPTPEAVSFFKRVLSKRLVHSVRDEMTASRLRAMGFANVENTSCPTLWGLDGKTEADFAGPNRSTVLTMVSVWRKMPEEDRRLLAMLKKHYARVVVWPQGHKDLEYLAELGVEGVERLEYSMEALEAFIRSNPEAEYLGYRLHGGIRCMQRGLRTLIIEVDNRAREIGRDTGLPTVERTDFARMQRWMEQGEAFRIRLNRAAIERVKNQFQVFAAKK